MRIVIKVGTSTLAHPTGHLNIRRVENICKILSDIKNAGNEVILVSSGAIGMGVGKLGLRTRPADIPTKQAAAAVGQCELMYTYDKLFNEYDVSNSGLVKADAKTMEMIKNANKKLEAVRDANGSIIGLDLAALSKKQQFERGQVLLTTTKIPENSDMARFVAEHPGVKVTHRVTTAGKLVYSVVDKWPIGGEIVDFDQDGKEIRRIGIKSMEHQRD